MPCHGPNLGLLLDIPQRHCIVVITDGYDLRDYGGPLYRRDLTVVLEREERVMICQVDLCFYAISSQDISQINFAHPTFCSTLRSEGLENNEAGEGGHNKPR